jgi:hypothetical protein
MNNYNLQDKRKNVSVDEICNIMECDTYSRKYITKLIDNDNNSVSPLDILKKKGIDNDSRLHAIFALDFFTEIEGLEFAIQLVKKMLYVFEKESEFYSLALRILEEYKSFLNGNPVNLDLIYNKIKLAKNGLSNYKQKLVFEALEKPFLVERKLVLPAIAGCMRAIADNEEERLKIVNQQIEYLIEWFSISNLFTL